MRLYFSRLQEYDLANDTSHVREIEMAVDASLLDTAYAVQFWKDVRMYGLKEAVLYLRNTEEVRTEEGLEEVERIVAQILRKLQ